MLKVNQQIEQENTAVVSVPNWVKSDGKKQEVDIYSLALSILKDTPIISVKAGNDYAYYSYNGVNWEQTTIQGATKLAQSEALMKLTKQGLYNVKRMTDTAKTVVVKSSLSDNPFNEQPKNLVAFKNGTYNLHTDKLIENNPLHAILNGHAYEAKLDGTADNIEAYGSYMFGNSWQFIKELIGYTFIPDRTDFQTITILLDEVGGTGKSYFFNKVIRPLIGIDNISDNSIEDLVGKKGGSNRFATFSLVNKLLNMHPDLKDHYIEEPDELKQLSGGDWIRTEGKGMNSGSNRNYALLLFASNHVPRIKIDSALYRRMNIVPVVAPSVEGNPFELQKRAGLWNESKLESEFGAFAINCIREAHKAIKRHQLTINDEIKERTAQWASEQDRVAMFLADSKQELEPDYNGGVTKRHAYECYKLWCTESGLPAYSKPVFEKSLRSKGFKEKKTRKHPEDGNKTGSNVMSWQGLALDKYFEQ